MNSPHLIYPVVDGYLSCFHFSAIMKVHPAMTIHIHILYDMFSFLLGIYLGVEMLGHMVILGLTIFKNHQTVCKADASFYISTSQG